MRSLELLESLFGSTVTAAVDEATRGVPLLPLIDQWAALPCRVSRSYDGADAATAWERRRNDLQHLAGITDVLTDVERRADELNRRAAELVEDWL